MYATILVTVWSPEVLYVGHNVAPSVCIMCPKAHMPVVTLVKFLYSEASLGFGQELYNYRGREQTCPPSPLCSPAHMSHSRVPGLPLFPLCPQEPLVVCTHSIKLPCLIKYRCWHIEQLHFESVSVKICKLLMLSSRRTSSLWRS